MSVLSGEMIRLHSIITPHVPRTEIEFEGRKLSFGQGFAGYDVRVEFEEGQDAWMFEPGEFRLASTIEHFRMRSDIIAEVKDKSSWARRGITVQNTVIEPGWRGHLTLELTNHSRQYITIQRGMPIAQILFYQIEFTQQEIAHGLKGYDGKYQDQERGPQDAR